MRAEVKDRQRARDASRFACRDEREVPPANDTKHAETAANFEQIGDVREVFWRRGVRNRKIS